MVRKKPKLIFLCLILFIFDYIRELGMLGCQSSIGWGGISEKRRKIIVLGLLFIS